MSEKMRGKVLRIVADKGFAFIRGTDGLTRFMHVSAFVKRVEFDMLREDPPSIVLFHPANAGNDSRGNGLRAVDVELVNDAAQVG